LRRGHVAAAQAKAAATPIFGVGYTDIGGVIGVGGVGSASASFGGRFEHAIKALPDLGGGMLGIQAAFDYYSWSGGTGLGTYSWKYIPIGVTANYHFKISEPKLDPFVGLGLGYQYITCDAPGLGSGYCSSSAIYFIGRAGAIFSTRVMRCTEMPAPGRDTQPRRDVQVELTGGGEKERGVHAGLALCLS
jgi:hypothetical protein